MILARKASEQLANWRTKNNHKPLILRGARQVGKSTLVRDFGLNFKYFIELNLERSNDKVYFEKEREIKEIWEELLFDKNIPDEPNETLLFIDEIQEMPHVIKLLRYFYEDLPNLYVISAGSLLEFALGKVSSYPVGRVEEINIFPLDFEEFLMACKEDSSVKQLRNIPIPNFAYNKLFQLFKRYMIIGGMPEVIKNYVESNYSVVGLKEIYASIWNTYKGDIVKYAKNDTESKILRFVIETAPLVRDRINFAGFGGSNYRSREIGEAFQALELAKIIYLIYPTTHISPPQLPELGRKPRLQFLDTGLLNFASEIQTELLALDDLNDYYRGFVVNHCLTQELMANGQNRIGKPQFWVRENNKANAEVDLTYKWQNLLIPIEVKSGAKGSLRSLHEFMDIAPHNFAIRFLNNKISIEHVKTRKGKIFNLLNLPYFAISQLDKYIEWGMTETNNPVTKYLEL